MSASTRYDAIVVGGGHNGLINGAYLARAGLKTLILERRHVVGGAAVTEEPFPGYRFATFSYAVSLLRPRIVRELELFKHGFQLLGMPTSFAPAEDGGYLLLDDDAGSDLAEIARHSAHDAETYPRYQHDVTEVCRAIEPLLDRIPPDPFSDDPLDLARMAELADHLKKLDKQVFHNAVRLLTGSAADFLDDYFRGDLLKGYLVSSGIIGSRVGPMSQGSGLVLLYHLLGKQDGEYGRWAFHKGGNGEFTQVLARAARSFGAEIATQHPVEAVLTAEGRVRGVALVDGTELSADIVVSSLDPRRTFLELVDRRQLPDDLVSAIERYRFRGVSAKVNFALGDTPHFPALADRTDHYRGFINIGPSIEYLERAFDEGKYGWYSSRPFIDASVLSMIDPDMAPPGRHVLSCFVQYTPYELRQSDWEAERESLGDTVQATLESFFPGFGDQVIHRDVVTPLDIEKVVGLSEGNIFAGEFLGPQMFFFRPAPGWNQYRTPLHGYYQCGSGTHPGGCVMGAPGMLAAEQILGDLGRENDSASTR